MTTFGWSSCYVSLDACRVRVRNSGRKRHSPSQIIRKLAEADRIAADRP
jgi:hypothetical protein